eukprot:TRINITY_DN11171_c0_g1_i1.p1 TRINITY_DN11171_c0_g1~~TRINITY_DN11171_c0_g1_i1.p1  ORF type:complete len:539 (+),score=231.07 TRINITY_DN11171_c0_g1_i1:101-1618(+)
MATEGAAASDASPERGDAPPPAAAGGTADLREQVSRLEERHQQQREVLCLTVNKLREAQTLLTKAMAEEADGRDGYERGVEAAEQRNADLEVGVRRLQVEVEDATSKLAELAQLERQLHARREESAAAAERCERVNAEDSVLSGDPEDWVAWLQEVEGREVDLRDLEDRMLGVEELIEKQMLELEQLRGEAAALQREGPGADTLELEKQRQVAQALQRTLHKLQQRRDEAARKREKLRGQVGEIEAQAAELAEEQAGLQQRLEAELLAQDRTEQALGRELEAANSAQQSEEQYRQLEEAMMLVKAAAINLALDTGFISDVCATYRCGAAPGGPSAAASDSGSAAPPPAPSPSPGPERGPSAAEGFDAAFSFLRHHITRVHGPQREGDRWLLRHPERAPEADEVEGLLSAVKQMVVCFDAMHSDARRRVPLAREVTRNGTNIREMAFDLTARYGQLVEARQAQEEVERKAQQERARRAVAAAAARRAVAAAAQPQLSPPRPGGPSR